MYGNQVNKGLKNETERALTSCSQAGGTLLSLRLLGSDLGPGVLGERPTPESLVKSPYR